MLDVVIPNYNGGTLLRRYLPGVLEAFGADGRIIVVDDCSRDDSVEILRREFPGVELIVRKSNGGFSIAVNDGIRAASTEFILLLNTDVNVEPGLLEPIMPLFDDESVFAASPRVLTTSLGGLDDGAKTGIWHHGLFWTDHVLGVTECQPVLYTSGCASVYRRSMLMELGGFDEAYAPFNWEDVDLGYRAWKRGWQSLYQPKCAVNHEHSATISRMKAAHTNRVTTRNSLLFIWRNIDDARLLADHRLWLPLVTARRTFERDWPFVAGWNDARLLRREALAARAREAASRCLSDREIFAIAGVKVACLGA